MRARLPAYCSEQQCGSHIGDPGVRATRQAPLARCHPAPVVRFMQPSPRLETPAPDEAIGEPAHTDGNSIQHKTMAAVAPAERAVLAVHRGNAHQGVDPGPARSPLAGGTAIPRRRARDDRPAKRVLAGLFCGALQLQQSPKIDHVGERSPRTTGQRTESVQSDDTGIGQAFASATACVGDRRKRRRHGQRATIAKGHGAQHRRSRRQYQQVTMRAGWPRPCGE